MKKTAQQQTPLQHKNTYAIAEFNIHHDQEFIKNSYQCILQRPADPQGEAYFLAKLRQGGMSKERIVAALKHSKEGQKNNVTITGVKKYHWLNKLAAIAGKAPLLSGLLFVVRLSEGVIKIAALTERLNQIDAANYQMNNSIAQQQKESAESARRSQLKNEQTQQEIGRNNSYLLQQQSNISDLIQRLQQQPELNAQKVIDELEQQQSHFLDLLYVAFEDKYRGSEEQIKQQVAIYLPYIYSVYEKGCPVLDIGCGRGEWVELMQENGYQATGVDLNAVMVSQAKEKQLNVECVDVLQYLKRLPDNALSAVTGIHIIEHLEFTYLIELLQEIYRVLKKGGGVILETPNPENVFVGAQFFYTDPTHKNPIVPTTLEFLLHYLGYGTVEIKRLHSYAEISKQQGKPRDMSDDFKNSHFYGSMDFAVIAHKE